MSSYGNLLLKSPRSFAEELMTSVLFAVLINSTGFAAGVVKAPQSAVPTTAIEENILDTKQPQAAKNVKTLAKSSGNSSIFIDAKIAAPASKVIALGEITTEVEGDQTIVTARLNRIPEWKDIVIEEHGTFLQIKMANTLIPASGEFIDGNGPFLKKIASFQLPNEDGAIRFFINQDASKAKLATTAELIGNRVIVTIDHTKLEQLIMNQGGRPAALTASDIVAKTEVNKELTAPGDLISDKATAADNTANKSADKAPDKSPDKLDDKLANKSGEPAPANPELRSQLSKAAGFFAFMLLALVASQVVRAKRRKSGNFALSSSIALPTALKVLSSISVGQKQKVTLLQVGNQEILIGVGPESVNLITIIESASKNNQFARHLDAANPGSDIRLKSPSQPTLPLQPRRPMASSTTRSPTLSSDPTPVKGTRINVGVGDDGAKNMDSAVSQKSDDITKILRDRLRNLPAR